MAKSNKKAYVVWKGRQPGVYYTWPECEQQVKGFVGAKFKGFPSEDEAVRAYSQPESMHIRSPSSTSKQRKPSENFVGAPTGPYIAVDAAYGGSSKLTEWRGVLVDQNGSHSELFRSAAYHGGSANVGEFIAIVDALLISNQQNLTYPIYSDSYNAQLWVKKGQHASGVYSCDELKALLDQCNNHLRAGLYRDIKRRVKLIDWKTKWWGEIPADFGRKGGKGLPISNIVHR